MSRNLWIGIVAVIVLGIGGWWYLNQSSAPTTSDTASLSTTEQTTQQNTNTGTQPAVNNQQPQTTPASSNLMKPGETRPIGGVTPQCVSGYSVEQTCAQVGQPSTCVWQCVVIQAAPQGVTIDQSSLASSVGNPVLSGQAGTITSGSDLYVSVYNADGKVWGSGNANPTVSNNRWSIQVGAPDARFSLPSGTYTVYIGDPRTPLATGVLKITNQSSQNKPIHYPDAAVEIYPNAMVVTPTSGTAPLKVTFSNFAAGCANETDLYFGDTPSAMASNGFNGSWPAGGVIHTYNSPGTYTAELYCSSSPITLENQVTITVR